MKNHYLQPLQWICVITSLVLMSGCSGEYRQVVDDLVQKIRNNPQYYVRGGFNNWGDSSPFKHVEDDLWQVTIEVGLGTHEYKIATKDWQTQLMINDRNKAVVDAVSGSQEFLLGINQTEDADILWVEKAGIYQFTLNLEEEERPQVTVKRMGDLVLRTSLKHNPNTTKTLNFSTFDKRTYQVDLSYYTIDNGLRTYVHSSEQPLRDPVPQISQYSEDERFPYLRSGNVTFDGLFALAIDEMKLDSVSEIKDGAYNNGEAIDCFCFKTGEKWDYVWTRDLSYAANLSLSILDPQRVKNSLDFKLSPYRDGISKPLHAAGDETGLQIIQDTGSGGSWPISTDRVTWALGAETTLNNLAGVERKEFAIKALTALKNTLDIDRQVIFDAHTGLYNGEQSFLDWREQTYADWIKDDLSAMATAKSVSTNVTHYQAMRLAQTLATELGEPSLAKKYGNWANALKVSINQHLWLEEQGLYSSLTASHFDDQPMAKFDWLGQSLAIISGIASSEQTDKILASYPHGPMGAPVIFPQQSGVRVYHNRALWPFVTAYGLKAGIEGNNVSVVNAAYASLIRGAALNISNMENLEWLSGQSIWLEREDSKLSGPVINSKSQLWSVGGYLGMVIEGVFGIHVDANQIQLKPYLTSQLKQRFFSNQQQLHLKNLTIQGKPINVQLTMPKRVKNQGVYRVERIMVNGQTLLGSAVDIAKLNDTENLIRIDLGRIVPGKTAITKLKAQTGPVDDNIFSPFEATIQLTPQGNSIGLDIVDGKNTTPVTYNIYRNGQLVADKLKTKSWVDSTPVGHQACYSVDVTFVSSGNVSHHSPVTCTQSGINIAVNDKRVKTNKPLVTMVNEQPILEAWGAVEDNLQINGIEIKAKGDYAFQVEYRNLFNKTNTGITAGVKWVVIKDAQQNVIHSQVIQLPHTKSSNGPALSTPVTANLEVGSYSIEMTDFMNMSYLTNNQTYSQSGGESGALNKFDIYGFKLMPVFNR